MKELAREEDEICLNLMREHLGSDGLSQLQKQYNCRGIASFYSEERKEVIRQQIKDHILEIIEEYRKERYGHRDSLGFKKRHPDYIEKLFEKK